MRTYEGFSDGGSRGIAEPRPEEWTVEASNNGVSPARQPFSIKIFFHFSRLCKSGNLEESAIVEIEIPATIEREGKEDSGFGIRDLGFGIWDSGFGMSDSGRKTWLNTGRMISAAL